MWAATSCELPYKKFAYLEHFPDGTTKDITAEIPFQIPENWRWCRLGEIQQIVTGSTPSKSSESFYGGDYPFYKPTDLDKGYYVSEAQDNLTFLGYEQSRKLPEKSILVTCIGATIGKTGLIRKEGTCNQQINAILTNKNISPEFSYFVCISPFFQDSIIQNASATTLPILNKSKFEELFFPLPPLQEQHRIVQKIGQLFALIEKIEDNKEALKVLIKQAKSQVLSDAIAGKLTEQDPNDEPATELLKRLGTTAYTPYEKKLPNGWAWCRLGDVCVFENGYAFSSNDYQKEGIPLIRISNIKNGKIDISEAVCLNTEYDERFIVENGDLLIAMSGATTGKMGVYQSKEKALLNQRVGNIKVKNKDIFTHKFRDYFMQTKSEEILKMAYGGAQPNISGKMIENLQVSLPPLKEQHHIVQKIEAYFTEFDKIQEMLV